MVVRGVVRNLGGSQDAAADAVAVADAVADAIAVAVAVGSCIRTSRRVRRGRALLWAWVRFLSHGVRPRQSVVAQTGCERRPRASDLLRNLRVEGVRVRNKPSAERMEWVPANREPLTAPRRACTRLRQRQSVALGCARTFGSAQPRFHDRRRQLRLLRLGRRLVHALRPAHQRGRRRLRQPGHRQRRSAAGCALVQHHRGAQQPRLQHPHSLRA